MKMFDLNNNGKIDAWEVAVWLILGFIAGNVTGYVLNLL